MALPGALPWAFNVAQFGSSISINSASPVKRAFTVPKPIAAMARNFRSPSRTSTDSTPGMHWPTLYGSMRNAHTSSRGALMLIDPSKCCIMPPLGIKDHLDQKVKGSTDPLESVILSGAKDDRDSWYSLA